MHEVQSFRRRECMIMERGFLLGTDSQELQGAPIVMKKENFTQEMGHGDKL